jgi:regulator of cell morphogenesis and NO signaling
MNIRKTDTVGSIVTQNIQAASVFNSYGIDYYAHGQRTLEEACIKENVPIVNLFEELWELDRPDTEYEFAKMDMIRLSTYILRNHHKFAEKKVTFIKHSLTNLVSVFGEKLPYLLRIKKEFDELSLYLTVHMKHEEFIVFPYIQKMVRNSGHNLNTLQTIQRPISSMKEDHDHEVIALKKIRELTNNYQAPKRSDYALIVTYRAMKELEEDLKIHMHLENNLLFPKAIKFAECVQKSNA